MRKLFSALITLCCLVVFTACNNYETYSEKKDKERDAISKFLADSSIVVISESEFHEKGDVTDFSRNEYVYLNNSGVYLQIEHKGCGTPIKDGETTTLIMRYSEECLYDQTGSYNDTSPYSPDFMRVERNGNTYTASFTTTSRMYQAYGTTSVPSGLLVAFPYINVGRARTESDQIAKIHLIVPHSQGNVTASSYVYPYYYVITYQREIDL